MVKARLAFNKTGKKVFDRALLQPRQLRGLDTGVNDPVFALPIWKTIGESVGLVEQHWF